MAKDQANKTSHLCPALEFTFQSCSKLATEVSQLRSESRLSEAVDLCCRTLAETELTATETLTAYFQRGLTYSSQENHLPAIADFSEAIRLLGNPKSKEVENRIKLAEALLWRGLNHFQSSNFTEAESDVKKASDVLANVSVSARARKENEAYFAEALARSDDDIGKFWECLSRGVLTYCGTEWRSSVEDFDAVLKSEAEESLEPRIVASLLRSCWCFRNSNDVIGIRAALAEAWELSFSTFTKEVKREIDSSEKNGHSVGTGESEEGHGLTGDDRSPQAVTDISNARISDVLNLVAANHLEIGPCRGRLEELLGSLNAIEHAATLGLDVKAVNQEALNQWIQGHRETDWTTEQKRSVLEAIRFFANKFRLQFKFTPDKGDPIPCRLVIKKMGETTTKHVFRVFASGRDGKFLTDDKCLPNMALEPK